MAHGDGSFYQDGRGYWVATVNLPPGPDGKRRRKVIRRESKAAVVKERLRVLGELATHGDVITVTPTVAAWCETWLTTIAMERLRPATHATYAGYVRRWILPAIGKVRLANLTSRHVEAVQDLAKTGYGEGPSARKPVSSTTRLQIHRILAVILRDAVRAGHLRANPADRDHVAAPRKRHVETAVLTGEQTRTLLEAVAGHERAARWALALFTGMRQGECLGVERAAVDLERGLLTVRWQAQKLLPGQRPDESIPQRDLGRNHWLLPPKTSGSFRVVPIIEPLHVALAAHMETMPPPAERHDLLFRRPDGMPLDKKTDRSEWKGILEGAGLPTVRLHDARHGVATLLLEAGVDIHVIQTIMGHSSVLTTKGYAHVNTRLAREGLERMERLLTA